MTFFDPSPLTAEIDSVMANGLVTWAQVASRDRIGSEHVWYTHSYVFHIPMPPFQPRLLASSALEAHPHGSASRPDYRDDGVRKRAR